MNGIGNCDVSTCGMNGNVICGDRRVCGMMVVVNLSVNWNAIEMRICYGIRNGERECWTE